MTDVQLADVSEYQTNVDADTYLRGGYRVIICRVHNGYRPDHMMPSRRNYLRGCGLAGIGWYQYFAADQDPASQAHEFIATLGDLRDNEWVILDHEEGAGDQRSRAEAWFRVVDDWAGFPAMLYAGDYFLRDNLGGSGYWGERPIWIAAYPSNYQPSAAAEPTQKHLLWQFSDRQQFPGLGAVDGNLAHSGYNELVVAARSGAAAPEPKPEPELVISIGIENAFVARNADGRLEAFAEADDGKVWHCYQPQPNAGWTDWFSLGRPGG